MNPHQLYGGSSATAGLDRGLFGHFISSSPHGDESMIIGIMDSKV